MNIQCTIVTVSIELFKTGSYGDIPDCLCEENLKNGMVVPQGHLLLPFVEMLINLWYK